MHLFLQLKVVPLMLEIHKLRDLGEMMTKFQTKKSKVVKIGPTGRTGNWTCIQSGWCRKSFRKETGNKPRKPDKNR
jgi:hypothetical protein